MLTFDSQIYFLVKSPMSSLKESLFPNGSAELSLSIWEGSWIEALKFKKNLWMLIGRAFGEWTNGFHLLSSFFFPQIFWLSDSSIASTLLDDRKSSLWRETGAHFGLLSKTYKTLLKVWVLNFESFSKVGGLKLKRTLVESSFSPTSIHAIWMLSLAFIGVCSAGAFVAAQMHDHRRFLLNKLYSN